MQYWRLREHRIPCVNHNWPRHGEKRQNVWAAKLGVFKVLESLEYFGVFSERTEEVEIG